MELSIVHAKPRPKVAVGIFSGAQLNGPVENENVGKEREKMHKGLKVVEIENWWYLLYL